MQCECTSSSALSSEGSAPPPPRLAATAFLRDSLSPSYTHTHTHTHTFPGCTCALLTLSVLKERPSPYRLNREIIINTHYHCYIHVHSSEWRTRCTLHIHCMYTCRRVAFRGGAQGGIRPPFVASCPPKFFSGFTCSTVHTFKRATLSFILPPHHPFSKCNPDVYIPAILQECGVDLGLFINCGRGHIWFLVPALRFVGLLHIYTHVV